MKYIIIVLIGFFITVCSISCMDKKLSFVGRASHHDAQIATEMAKQEAIEKLLFEAGITIVGRMTDTLDYSKIYSSSQPREEGEIKFSKTIMVMHSFLKDLNLQMETKLIQNNQTYTSIVTLRVSRSALIRAKKAGNRVQTQKVKEQAKRGKQTLFWIQTWKLIRCLTFGLIALIVIPATLSISGNLLNWNNGIHPLGLLLISISTALLILLFWLFFGKIPGFIMEIIKGLGI